MDRRVVHSCEPKKHCRRFARGLAAKDHIYLGLLYSPICGQWLEVDHALALIKRQAHNAIHQHEAIVVNLGLRKIRIGIHGCAVNMQINKTAEHIVVPIIYLDASDAR